MQLNDKNAVKKVLKGTKNFLALNMYVYSLNAKDWVTVAELLQKSNEAVVNKTSTWILVEQDKINERVKASLLSYFSYRFKMDENHKEKIFVINGKNFYKLQQKTEK